MPMMQLAVGVLWVLTLVVLFAVAGWRLPRDAPDARAAGRAPRRLPRA